MPDKICDTCCREIPVGAPGGLCPVCLLRAGLGDMSQDEGTKKTTPYSADAPSIPTAEELTPFFPQLEILSLLGQGGMGSVYLARQTKLDRPVALKIIRPESAADPSFAERFAREARTLARLNHPNIVGIHDFGEFDEGYFFVMEYVSGANLRQILNDGRLEQSQSLSIVRQICEALQYAHDEGVVHRDIKPENILVDQAGRIKIADFGLARLNATAQGEDAEKYFTLTGTHQIMGTPRYMAPEQIEASSRVDHRADIYSLGVVFYEMLTGEVPMGSFEPPSRKEAVDNRLDEVVLKAMAREPDRRYQQVSSLAQDVVSIDPSAIERNPVSPGQIEYGDSADTNPSRTLDDDGFTAIFDRDFKAVVPWVVTSFAPEKTIKRHRAPVLVMIALAVIGTLATLFPWVEYSAKPLTKQQIAAGNAAAGRPSDRGHELAPKRIPVSPVNGVIADRGIDLITGWVVAIGFTAIAMLLLIVPIKQQMPMSLAICVTALSVIILIALTLFSSASLPFATNVTKFKPGFFVSLGCGMSLMLLGVVAFRHAITTRADAAVNKHPKDLTADGHLQGGPDWVTITQQDIDDGAIPNLCIVCGDTSVSCVNRTFHYKPKFFLEMSRGVNPWASFVTREFRLPCPVCPKHRNHWTKFILICSTGWVAPLVFGGLGSAIAFKLGRNDPALIGVFSSIGFFVPLAIWIGTMIRLGSQQISTIRIEKNSITLNRVSWKFAKAIRGDSSTDL